MQQFINKHNKVLFSVLLVVIIIAFVFTIGAPGIGYKQKKSKMFYGYNLSSQKDTNNVIFATQLTAELEGTTFQNPSQVEYAFLARIIILDIAKNLHIPKATDAQIKTYIELLPMLQDENKFSHTKYKNLIGTLQANGKKESELRKIFDENIKIQYVSNLLSGGKIVFDHQTNEVILNLKTSWDFSVATILLQDFNQNIEISDEDLIKFFQDHEKQYMSPIQFKVSYLTFPVKNFIESVKKPSKEDLNNFYAKNKENFAKIEGKENIKKAIAEEYYNNEAKILACNEAEQFVSNVSSNDILLKSQDAENLLKMLHCTVTDLAPYTILDLPQIADFDEKVLANVQSLDMQQRYSDPIDMGNKFVVLYIEDVIAGKQMNFEEAKSFVNSDVKLIKTLKSFHKYGEEIKDKLLAQINNHQPIEAIARQFNLSVENHLSASLDKNKNIPQHFFEILINMNNEKVKMLVNEDKIIYVCKNNKFVPELSDISSDDISHIRSELGLIFSNMYMNSVIENLTIKGLYQLK